MSPPWTQIPGAERKSCWDCWPARSSSSMSSPLRTQARLLQCTFLTLNWMCFPGQPGHSIICYVKVKICQNKYIYICLNMFKQSPKDIPCFAHLIKLILTFSLSQSITEEEEILKSPFFGIAP
jgi:hypothetical protein